MESIVKAFASAFDTVAGRAVDPVVRRSKHADFQVEGALALGRELRRPPREVAADVLGHVAAQGFDAVVAGAGFINVTVGDDWLAGRLAEAASDPRLGVPVTDTPEVVAIDYSAPNVAKEMHVGNLRSTVIGDAVARLLEWLGHDVRRINHIGDWGTSFGMLLEHLEESGSPDEAGIGDLDAFYKAARARFAADEEFAERSRQRVVALQSGDEATLRLWHKHVDESERYLLAVYATMGVTMSKEDFVGESFYNPMLGPLVEELESAGLLRDSDGAKCLFPDGFSGRDGEPLPIIVRKRDGGFGYSATDLAAIRYRIKNLKADRVLYVVGAPQAKHFAMVFAAARAAGWLTGSVRAEHVQFGSVLGADGKLLRSRAGDGVKLRELLDEAVARAYEIVGPSLEDGERHAVARAVGIGAVKYADLSNHRLKDYVFDWDRMLATNGDTAAYLQYACARVASILRRAGGSATASIVLTHPSERALALELLGFPGVVEAVAQTFEFQKLTGYLFGLAGAFNAFFRDCRVLQAEDDASRASRLVMCDLTRRTMVQGMGLLGIEVPERM
ncbi:MAG TPA: arginine--tRNA ligase [Candidatus Limnocylindrales bacterium]